MIIGTAGHIDHGKTTLVKALTGVDCDRLKEEKARLGITLDLGYAYTSTLGFIDVPGHEKLIRNMLAGATGIDFALLVVAADDGPMPQTREHLEIIELLGIRRGAVALTKIDVVTRAMILRARGDAAGALRLDRSAYEITSRDRGAGHPRAARYALTYAPALREGGGITEAEALGTRVPATAGGGLLADLRIPPSVAAPC